MSGISERLAEAARYLTSVHRPNDLPNALIVSAPRSGSTWLLELVLTQPGFKPCSEPFNLRKQAVVRRLGLERWEQLNDEDNLPQMKAYLETFLENRYVAAFKGLRPGQPFHRYLTHRIAFKILFACEHRLDWLQQTLRARTVVMVRHPIPVALSRKALPRLESFLEPGFREHLSPEQLRAARRLAASGDGLQRAVLDWCLQYCVPLQRFREDFLLVTYEQLVMRPEPVLHALADHLQLPSVEPMRARIGRPSASVSKSGAATASFLSDGSARDDRRWLIDKWRSSLSSQREDALMHIVQDFDIDVYAAGDSMPVDRYRL